VKTYGALAAIAVVVLLWALIRYIEYRMRESFAIEQIEMFDEVVSKALETDDREAVMQAREYVKEYYPQGTKQRDGTRLNTIVEICRDLSLRCLDYHLDSLPKE
jgi:hypothetical protein